MCNNAGTCVILIVICKRACTRIMVYYGVIIRYILLCNLCPAIAHVTREKSKYECIKHLAIIINV